MTRSQQTSQLASIEYNQDVVRPLHEAENEFLQVLVTEFTLRSKGRGIELRVPFSPETPTIWLRQAKRYILQQLSDIRRIEYQKKFDLLFSQEKINYRHSDSTFPFRFGNGGTLPVVRVDQTDYYCLFYRDAHPAGWNIANGGANNLHDLLHPDAIIERELREELIIVEPKRGRRYVFDWHNARMQDHPDFALANHLWRERFLRQGFKEFTEIPLPLKWLPAHDIDEAKNTQGNYDSVCVNYGDDPVYTNYGLLNINGEDFGIEFDRIAKLAVGPEAIFCDGEISQGSLLNRVVGLFEVGKMNTSLAAGETNFIPNRLFWNGQDLTGENPAEIIEKYLRSSSRHQNVAQTDGAIEDTTTKLDLCPVTRNIINRYLQMTETPEPTAAAPKHNKSFDVFVSFGSEDRILAEQVFNRLCKNGNQRVFFSDVSLNHGPFSAQIDNALDTSRALVAVGSRAEHLHKSWVRYEWESFHNDILSGRKPIHTPFVAFVTGIDIHDLPRPFRDRTVVQAKKTQTDEALQRLVEHVSKTGNSEK